METDARLFADYEPDPLARVEQASLWCRIAARGDEAAVAALIVTREGGALDETEAALLDGWIPSRAGRALFVAGLAESPERVFGFGRVARFEPPADAPTNCAPAGYYLAGVIVDRDARRRGLGRRLTEARIAWAAERDAELHFFCNARNRASIDLHRGLGFVETTRDFWFPGANFVGGEGILFHLPRGASRVDGKQA